MERTVKENQQKPERVDKANFAISVHSIWPTIQGEGPFVGYPAVFLRLAGCNLQCPFCDTDYTKGRWMEQVLDLVKDVEAVMSLHKRKLVVITGGEPFRQPLALDYFIRRLLDRDPSYLVQIETNGVLCPEAVKLVNQLHWGHPRLSIVCSPKTAKVTIPGHRVAAWKYVLEREACSGVDGLPTSVLGNGIEVARPPKSAKRVYVQPMDEQDDERNAVNLEHAIWTCSTFGYILCVQLHKILGVD